MAKPTVRDIHEIVNGLTQLAAELRSASSVSPIEGQEKPMVPALVSGLLGQAASMESYATTLRELIPEDEIEVEDDS